MNIFPLLLVLKPMLEYIINYILPYCYFLDKYACLFITVFNFSNYFIDQLDLVV